MNDADGGFTYSRVAAIAGIKSSGWLLLYPNPVTGSTLQVQVNTNSASAVTLQIQDMSGRQISLQTFMVAANSTTTLPVDVSGLPTGMYQLKSTDTYSTSVKPFSVQH